MARVSLLPRLRLNAGSQKHSIMIESKETEKGQGDECTGEGMIDIDDIRKAQGLAEDLPLGKTLVASTIEARSPDCLNDLLLSIKTEEFHVREEDR